MHCGSLEIRLPVMTLYLEIYHKLSESVLSLKSRVSLKGHGIPLLSVKILRWYQFMFRFRDPIFFHHHGVWFASNIKHNLLNSSSTSNGETRSNYVEGSGSVVLISSDEVFLKWCGHMWGIGIEIQFNVIYCFHWSRACHNIFSCIRVRSEFRNTRHALGVCCNPNTFPKASLLVH